MPGGRRGRGGFIVAIGANTRGLTSGFQRAQAQLATFSRTVRTSGVASLKVFGDASGRFGRTFTRSVTAPLLGGVAAVSKLALDFEKGITRISTLTGIARSDAVALGAEVVEIANRTATAYDKLSQSLLVSVSAGFRGQAALNITEQAAKLAALGFGELDVITRALTVTLENYSTSGLTAARASDILLATAQEGNFDVSQLADVFGQLLSNANALHIPLESVSASFAVLTRATGSATEAQTRLTGIFNAFLKPSDNAKIAFDQVGLSVAQLRRQLESDGLQPTLLTIRDALRDVGIDLSQVFGRIQGLAGVQTLVAEGNTYAAVLDNVADSVGEVNFQYSIWAETSEGQVQQSLVNLKNSVTEIGQEVLPVASEAVGFLSDRLSGMADILKNLSPTTRRLVVAVGALAVTLPLVASAVSKLVTLALAARTALLALTTALTGGAGLLVAAGLIAGIAGVGLLYNAFIKTDDSAAKLESQVDALTSALGRQRDELKALAEQAGTTNDEIVSSITGFEDVIASQYSVGGLAHLLNAPGLATSDARTAAEQIFQGDNAERSLEQLAEARQLLADLNLTDPYSGFTDPDPDSRRISDLLNTRPHVGNITTEQFEALRDSVALPSFEDQVTEAGQLFAEALATVDIPEAYASRLQGELVARLGAATSLEDAEEIVTDTIQRLATVEEGVEAFGNSADEAKRQFLALADATRSGLSLNDQRRFDEIAAEAYADPRIYEQALLTVAALTQNSEAAREAAERFGTLAQAQANLSTHQAEYIRLTRVASAASNKQASAIKRVGTATRSLREQLGLNDEVLGEEEGLQQLAVARDDALLYGLDNQLSRDPELLDEYNQRTIDALQTWFGAIDGYAKQLGRSGQFGELDRVLANQLDTLRQLETSVPTDTYARLVKRIGDIGRAARDPKSNGSSASTVSVGVELSTSDLALAEIALAKWVEQVGETNPVIAGLTTEAAQRTLDEWSAYALADLGLATTIVRVDTRPAQIELNSFFELADAVALGLDVTAFTVNAENQVNELVNTPRELAVQAVLDTTRLEDELRALEDLYRAADYNAIVGGPLPPPVAPVSRAAPSGVATGYGGGGVAFYAAGGIVSRPTLGMVGEGGEPEAIVPLSRAGDFGFGGGSTTINVNISGDFYGDEDAFRTRIVAELRRHTQLNGQLVGA